MVEELPTWFAVPLIVVLSLVAAYRIFIAPGVGSGGRSGEDSGGDSGEL